MKNNIGSIVFGILIVAGIGAVVGLGVLKYDDMKNSQEIQNPVDNTIKGYTIRSGYLHGTIENSKEIISTRDELIKYCDLNNDFAYDGQGNVIESSGKLNRLLQDYDEEYFKEKSLALVYVELSSGSDSVEFVKATKFGSSINVSYKIVYPEDGIGTCDMSGYIVVVEITKDITKIL